MGNFKPLLATVLFILIVGFFLNIFISPYVDTTSPVSGSILANFSSSIENGWSINLPIIGSVSANPVSWLWLGIDGVTDFIVEQLNIMAYLSNSIAMIIIILSILGLAYSIATLIRGN